MKKILFTSNLFIDERLFHPNFNFFLGRLSVLSTQTNNTISAIQMKDVPDINVSNLKDLAPIG